MKNHKYKVGKRVVIRHGACAGPMTGVITKLTWYPVKASQAPRATYTVKGDDGLIYPLLGVDKECSVGNICSKDTKAGRIIETKYDYEMIESPKDDKYRIHNVITLRELCKKRGLPKYGSKRSLIEKLLAHDNLQKTSK
jgi:hypothetical protein